MKSKNIWFITSIILGSILLIIIGIFIGNQLSKPRTPAIVSQLESRSDSVVEPSTSPTPILEIESEPINSDESSINFDNGVSLRNGIYQSRLAMDGIAGYVMTLVGGGLDKKVFAGEIYFRYQNGSRDSEPEWKFIFRDKGYDDSLINWIGDPDVRKATWDRTSQNDMWIQFDCKDRFKEYYEEQDCKFYFYSDWPEQ